MKRSPLNRTSSLKRSRFEGKRKPLPRVNRKRARARRERDFGPYRDFVAAQHCCGCGKPAPSEPHHWKTRGSGGDWRFQVPLCFGCHRSVHAAGVKTFQAARGISFPGVAARLLGEWAEMQARAAA